MLVRFRLANHRSIRDDHELSLIATEFDEGTARATGLKHRGHHVSAQPVLGIFGANASGKSNLLGGLWLMRDAVRNSFADWAKAPGVVPREPFKLDSESRGQTSLFEVDLTLGRDPVRYTYGFELSDERVEAEWLHAYPHGRRNVWFDREAGRPESEGGEFVFRGEGFKGEREALAKLTRPNALFLSVGATLNDPQLVAIHRWFLNDLALVTAGGKARNRMSRTQRLLTHPDDADFYRERVGELLQAADLGITRLDIDPETSELRLWHRTSDDGEMPLDFLQEESLGTHAWFSFLGPMLTALKQGSILLVDELDSSLHPALAAEVLRVFQDPAANPNGAQLIFTTHDATLLGSEVLDRPIGRDQVWITTKRRSGETELYPLTAAKPRKEENLERGYLRGRYGGVPRMTAGEIVRELSRHEKKARA
ncbi:AAA family ATPase [Herbidospora yilanensis]|uniref:AAA family ATPase n=1 Tax=Herbidospora yilanensis TaxID=354426 RepID=UPI000781F6FA|nr:ATP-binding protein [Herbidospora yilanensis]